MCGKFLRQTRRRDDLSTSCPLLVPPRLSPARPTHNSTDSPTWLHSASPLVGRAWPLDAIPGWRVSSLARHVTRHATCLLLGGDSPWLPAPRMRTHPLSKLPSSISSCQRGQGWGIHPTSLTTRLQCLLALVPFRRRRSYTTTVSVQLH